MHIHFYANQQTFNFTAKPDISKCKVQITPRVIIVTWTFHKPRDDPLATTTVTIDIRYSSKSTVTVFPGSGPKIPATKQAAIIPGTFHEKVQYNVKMRVFEGGMLTAVIPLKSAVQKGEQLSLCYDAFLSRVTYKFVLITVM